MSRHVNAITGRLSLRPPQRHSLEILSVRWYQTFQSDAERKLAVILDREVLKWLKPVKGQFQMFYKTGTDDAEYVPDFVAETPADLYMLESKARNEMTDADVLAKQEAAVQ